MIYKSKLGIVIPTFNSQTYLRQSILSIANQEVDKQHRIHVHIQDGGSNDSTVEIINEFKNFHWPENFYYTFSIEEDRNMYQGLNRGFLHLDSEIMTYLGSDDILYPQSFKTAITFFTGWPNYHWITGLTSLVDECGILLTGGNQKSPHFQPNGFPNQLLRLGFFDGKHHPFVMQEGTYWTKDLWLQTGGNLDDNLNLAGDFELWVRFAQRQELIQLTIPLAAHRKRKGQLSENLAGYYSEIDAVLITKKENSQKEFSEFGLIATWNEVEKQFTISSEVNRNYWNGKLDFVLIDKEAYFEGPYPQFGVAESFIWIGNPVCFERLDKPMLDSLTQKIKVRILNDLEGNVLVFRQGDAVTERSLRVNDLVQEYFLEINANDHLIQIESKKTIKPPDESRLLGFKLLTIETIDVPH